MPDNFRGAILIFKLSDVDMEKMKTDYIGLEFDHQQFDACFDVVRWYFNPREEGKKKDKTMPESLQKVARRERDIDYIVGPIIGEDIKPRISSDPLVQLKLASKLEGKIEGSQLCIKTKKMADDFNYLDKVIFCPLSESNLNRYKDLKVSSSVPSSSYPLFKTPSDSVSSGLQAPPPPLPSISSFLEWDSDF